MEAWFLLLVCLLIPLVALLLARRGAGNTKSGSRIPPGRLAVPVLGSLVWLRHSSADLETLVRRLFERHGPVVSLRVESRLSIFVADRRVAHAALVERGAALADRPAVTRGLLGESGNTVARASYGPAWRLLCRNLVSETLHPSRVRLFAPARSWVRRVLVQKLLRESDKEAPPPPCGVMIVEAFRYAMFCLLVLMCFGERLDEAAVRAIGAAQRDWLFYVARKTSVFAFWPAVTKHLFRGRLRTGLALRRRKKELFLMLIDARQEIRRGAGSAAVPKVNGNTTLEHSYVDTLLNIKLRDEGEAGRPLTDDEMANLCSEFLNAGTDTTSTALQWIMAELVKNPRIQENLYNEFKSTTTGPEEVIEEEMNSMPYLKAVVLEGLRKHPPAHFVLAHKAVENIEISGYLFPKGATVNFMVADMGRDEREWQRPAEFVPERFLPGGDSEGVDVTGSREIRMMPFGVGRRICAGLGIAMLHLEYFVAVLVKEFQWKEVPGDEVDLAEKSEFTIVMAKPLRARLVPRRRNRRRFR